MNVDKVGGSIYLYTRRLLTFEPWQSGCLLLVQILWVLSGGDFDLSEGVLQDLV